MGGLFEEEEQEQEQAEAPAATPYSDPDYDDDPVGNRGSYQATSLDTLDPGSASYIDPGKKGPTPYSSDPDYDDAQLLTQNQEQMLKEQKIADSKKGTAQPVVLDYFDESDKGSRTIQSDPNKGKVVLDYLDELDQGSAPAPTPVQGPSPEDPTEDPAEDGTPDEAVEEGPAAPAVSPDAKPQKPKKRRGRKKRVGRQVYQGEDPLRAGVRGRGAGRRGGSVIDNGTGGTPYNDALGG